MHCRSAPVRTRCRPRKASPRKPPTIVFEVRGLEGKPYVWSKSLRSVVRVVLAAAERDGAQADVNAARSLSFPLTTGGARSCVRRSKARGRPTVKKRRAPHRVVICPWAQVRLVAVRARVPAGRGSGIRFANPCCCRARPSALPPGRSGLTPPDLACLADHARLAGSARSTR